jgi:hypothetical protein
MKTHHYIIRVSKMGSRRSRRAAARSNRVRSPIRVLVVHQHTMMSSQGVWDGTDRETEAATPVNR